MEKTEKNRTYNCKDEELPVICGYVAYSFRRDLTEFTAFSSNFSDVYLTGFETTIKLVDELINPRSITVELKETTQRMNSNIQTLLSLTNKAGGYLKLAKNEIAVTPKDFGLSSLKSKIYRKDAEGIMQYARLVKSNLEKHIVPLKANGMPDSFIPDFSSTYAAIGADNQLQFEIISKRKEIASSNIALFNGLYSQMMEICNIGKIIFKGKSKQKYNEYTFTELKKKVRIISANSTK